MEVLLMGWDATAEEWVPIQVDSSGYVKVDLSAVNLDDLGDVDAAAPDDEDAIVYNSATGKWEASSLFLDELADHEANASAHHAKYTDAEAVTAAKTVKLDDFATPDDVTDLNATTGHHGLLLKLLGGSTKYLREDGTWATPSGGGGGGPTIVLKSADQDIASSTLLNDDDELVFAVGIDEIWHILMVYYFDCASSTPDMKAGFKVPTNGEFRWLKTNDIGPLAAPSASSQPAPYEYTGAVYYWFNALSAGVNYMQIVWGTYIGGDTAGDIQFQWGQLNSNATPVYVRANSYMMGWQLNA